MSRLILPSFNCADFQTVPSLDVSAKKLLANFLSYSQYMGITKRQTAIVDTVIVLDGSGSVPRCDFSKAKEALKHLMDTLHKPAYDSKYAAVTFATTATVNFKFLPYSSAASEIARIPYPDGSTNTQAGLAEAKKLFDDPASGTFLWCFLFYYRISFILLRTNRTEYFWKRLQLSYSGHKINSLTTNFGL